MTLRGAAKTRMLGTGAIAAVIAGLLLVCSSAAASYPKTRVGGFFEDRAVFLDGELELCVEMPSGKSSLVGPDGVGRNLFYNRYRYYDPAVGRYISPDPIGLAGATNVYTYPANTTGWIDPYGLAKKKGKDGCNGSPKGANNPVVRRAAGTGQEAHRQIEAKLKKDEGYATEVRMWLPKAKRKVRKDAKKGNEVVIIKPDTPTGHTAAEKREKLMKDEGFDTRTVFYDPTNPAYQPGSPTYMGPKPKK